MSEKTYDAIYKIAKNSEMSKIRIWAGFKEITGTLLNCEDNKCVQDIISLKDVTVKCPKGMEGEYTETKLNWLNIPSCHVMAFTFDCSHE